MAPGVGTSSRRARVPRGVCDDAIFSADISVGFSSSTTESVALASKCNWRLSGRLVIFHHSPGFSVRRFDLRSGADGRRLLRFDLEALDSCGVTGEAWRRALESLGMAGVNTDALGECLLFIE